MFHLFSRLRTRYACALSLLVCMLSAAPLLPGLARAQSYQLHQWTHFEDGTLPKDIFPIGFEFDSRVRVVEYAKIGDPPPGLADAAARRELGRFGLAVRSKAPNTPMTKTNALVGVAVGLVLVRSDLGENGRALFQADMYIPPTGNRVPNAAVIALDPLKGASETISNYYRFGFTLNKVAYFSHIPKDSSAPPTQFVGSSDMFRQVPRGGWHRLAIVCQGSRTIRCYIDGIEMPFSPVTDSSISTLQVGIVLGEKGIDYVAYFDNLSIQYSATDAPLPISPWLDAWPDELAENAGKENEKPLVTPVPPAGAKPAETPSGPAALSKIKPAAPPPSSDAEDQAVSEAEVATERAEQSRRTVGGASSTNPGGNTALASRATPKPAATASSTSRRASTLRSPFGLDTPGSAGASPAIRWLDTTEGWTRASSSNTPMFVAFVAPNIRSCQHFNEITRSSPAAATFIGKHVPILIDVNQLQGGSLAKKFGVFKVPSVVLLDSRGGILTKTVVGDQEDWASVESRLTSAR